MDGFLNLLFPPYCVGCGTFFFPSRYKYLCDRCEKRISSVNPQRCPYCEKQSPFGMTHVSCERRFGLDGLLSCVLYTPPITRLIQAWKYRFARDVEKDIVFLTRQKVVEATSFFCSDMVVVPLPSATRRLFWRGFNPPLTLAQELSNLYSMEVCQVLRKRFGKPQVGQSQKERSMNVRGAFELIEKGRVQEKKVVLVDDVWTTGSTLKEAGKVLKRDGRARRVYALTFARSLSHRG